MGVCKVLVTNFGPPIVVRGVSAPPNHAEYLSGCWLMHQLERKTLHTS